MQPSHRQRLTVSKPSFQNRPEQPEETSASVAPRRRAKTQSHDGKIPRAISLSSSATPIGSSFKPVLVADSAVQVVVAPEEDRPFELADFFTRDWMSRNSSFLISFVIHTFLLIMFSLVLIHSTGKALIVLELMSSPDVEEYQADLAEVDIDISDADEMIAALDDDPFNASLGESDGDQQVADVGIVPGAEGGGEMRQGMGDGKSAKFFGTKASGNSFVYVLDRSGSMAYESSDVENYKVSRFDVARMELIGSVESLQPHQEFYVVLFSTGMKQMFNENELLPKPVKATPENKARLKKWLWQDYAVGGTDPRESLKLAFKMKPDAIFMLSDGEFRDERDDGPLSIDIARKQVQEKSPIRINSIALEDQNSRSNMEELSDISGGQFRFVKVRDYLSQLPEVPQKWFRSQNSPRVFRTDLHQWKNRMELAQLMIDLLPSASPSDHQTAEQRLHELSYGIFERSIPLLRGNFNQANSEQAVEAWTDVWTKANAQTDLDTSTPVGLFSTLANVGKKDFLESVESIDALKLSPLDQIALAMSILDYQRNADAVNERTRGLLLGVLDELNEDSKAKFGKDRFLKSASLEACERRLETVLRNRRSFARKLHAKATNKSILAQVRIEHSKDLIALYPETKLAQETAENLKLPVSRVEPSDEASPSSPF